MDCALTAVRERVSENGKLSAARIEAEQHAVHGLAWLATYVEAIKEMAAYAARMRRRGPLRPDRGAAHPGGLGRISRPSLRRHPDEPGRDRAARRLRARPGRDCAVPHRSRRGADRLRQHPRKPRRPRCARIGEAREGAIGDPGLDETFEAIRGEMRRFADAEVAPHAQGWHRANAYIPLEVIAGLVGNGRVRPDHPGGLWRHGARQGGDVRGVGGAVARLYRRRLARHPLRNRRRTHPCRRHGGAEAESICRGSRAAKSCRPPSSPSRIPAPTSPACAPGRCAKATNTWSAGPRPGSPIPSAPT